MLVHLHEKIYELNTFSTYKVITIYFVNILHCNMYMILTSLTLKAIIYYLFTASKPLDLPNQVKWTDLFPQVQQGNQ